jgi:signal transduction histidine kinase
MSLRARLLIAFGVVVLVPLALLAIGWRGEMRGRLVEEYDRQLELAAGIIAVDLRNARAGVGERLGSLAVAMDADNRVRLAAVAGEETEERYLLDYAAEAMRLTGLSMLQVQDTDGRILSSGHFRNEHGRLEPGIAAALAAAGDGPAFVQARTPGGDFLALASAAPVVVGGRPFALVGGVRVDRPFLDRLAAGRGVEVTLEAAGQIPGPIASDTLPGRREDEPHARREIPVRLFRGDAAGGAPDETVLQLVVTQPREPLVALARRTDLWLVVTAAVAGGAALLLAVWVASRISRPLAALADRTAVLDLDRLDVAFDEGTDEVGRLARMLGDLAARLRLSTARVREAERRATVGDLARQVTHDIKNGLIPLRNVMRHLQQVGTESPGTLAPVLAERRPTIDSSLAYLETLATNYERLARAPLRRPCDLAIVLDEVARGIRGPGDIDVRVDVDPDVPTVLADPVALRRIVENLATNARESLGGTAGTIVLSARRVERPGEPALARVVVADTGRGMTPEEAGRIFADFYTTKPDGGGLGLSIVRRLVMDLHGTIRVESTLGVGTRLIVDLPATRAGAGMGRSA